MAGLTDPSSQQSTPHNINSNDSHPNIKLQKYYAFVDNLKQFVERRINKNISQFFKTNPYLATSKIQKEKVLY
jgi:hypothetical protein